MTKETLSAELAERLNMEKKVCRTVVDAMLAIVTEEMAKGETVLLSGFGSFETVCRGPRTARHPHTGETVEVPEMTVPRFRAGKALKEAVKK